MLKADIDELTRRFAAANASGGRQRLREKADDLVLDLLAALKTASLGEIAEATQSLERRRKTRKAALATINGSGAPRKKEMSSVAEASSSHAEHAPAPRDPFDITVPSDLLEPTSAPAFRGAGRSAKPVSDRSGLAATPSTRAERPLPTSVSLRAGEELLRTGGFGAIIRRVRGS